MSAARKRVKRVTKGCHRCLGRSYYESVTRESRTELIHLKLQLPKELRMARFSVLLSGVGTIVLSSIALATAPKKPANVVSEASA